MKRLNQFLFTTFIILCAAIAQTATDDLPARLQAEIDKFKNEVETQRGSALIESADLLTGNGISDPALYAIVEAKTKYLVSEHAAKPGDKVIAEELNAMIRALGSMSTQSRDLIASLVEGSSSQGIRSRARRLLPKLDWFAQRNAIMQKTDFYRPDQDLMTHRYLNLFASENPIMGRWALEELDRRRGAETEVYAKMREILSQQKYSVNSDVQLDYLAWICKVLSKYDASNSVELLKSIKNDPRNDKNFRKLKKYAKV